MNTAVRAEPVTNSKSLDRVFHRHDHRRCPLHPERIAHILDRLDAAPALEMSQTGAREAPWRVAALRRSISDLLLVDTCRREAGALSSQPGVEATRAAAFQVIRVAGDDDEIMLQARGGDEAIDDR